MSFNFNDLDAVTKKFINKHRNSCSANLISKGQIIYYITIALLAIVLLKYRWDIFVLVVTVFLAFWYLSATLLRSIASIIAMTGYGEDIVKSKEANAIADDALPYYTILLPMYKEANIAEKLIKNIDSLDYPHNKLDVKLLLEEDDHETQTAIENSNIPNYCEVIVVPDGMPRTKPRACNYGLLRAKGKYCVIFDAEDAPEPDQLKKALAVFRRDKTEKLACVQAKLNYYNSRYNLLTRLFTIEYSINFELMITGLQIFKLPLPLGGTSNHFRTDLLKEIGPWDPFNVTEDCDLGVRIYEHGYHTRVVDSTTWEEANSRIGNWIRQRSRWVKGFAQTHLVHFRNPIKTIKRLGLWGAYGGYLSIGGSVMMMLTNILFWGMMLLYGGLAIYGMSKGATISEIVIGPQLEGVPDIGFKLFNWNIQAWHLVYIGGSESPIWSTVSKVFFGIGIVLFFSNGIFVIVGILACIKRRFYHLIPYALLLPFYWVLISIGAWKGFLQLFTNPFYWEKTTHGIAEEYDNEYEEGFTDEK